LAAILRRERVSGVKLIPAEQIPIERGATLGPCPLDDCMPEVRARVGSALRRGALALASAPTARVTASRPPRTYSRLRLMLAPRYCLRGARLPGQIDALQAGLLRDGNRAPADGESWPLADAPARGVRWAIIAGRGWPGFSHRGGRIDLSWRNWLEMSVAQPPPIQTTRSLLTPNCSGRRRMLLT
jgi:hypothetical protein